MRRQNLATARLVVILHTNAFRPQDRQYATEQAVQLPEASSDTGRLNAAAMRALDAIWKPGYRRRG